MERALYDNINTSITAMARTHEQPFRGLPRELRDMIWSELLTVKHVPYSQPEEPAKQTASSSEVHNLVSKIRRLNNVGCDPLHLRVFLTNKQVYAETALIFYSSNEFITDAANLVSADRLQAIINPDTRRLRLITRACSIGDSSRPGSHLRYTVQGLKHCNIQTSFAYHRLDLVTINMPFEPPTLPKSADVAFAVVLSLATELVDGMLKGSIKRLRLVYPLLTGFVSPEQFFTIKTLRKGKSAINGEQGLELHRIWLAANHRGYIETLDKLRDIPDLDFVAKFEDSKSFKLPRDKCTIVLSRLEDEPVKKQTVARPAVTIVGPNSHLKRRFPGTSRIADPRPCKFPRLQLPSFLAFSESRNQKMSPRAVYDRQIGKNAQLRRLVSGGGKVLAQIPRETYRWQQHPNRGY